LKQWQHYVQHMWSLRGHQAVMLYECLQLHAQQ